MAFDGITVACMAHELHKNLSGGRISKIAQPETDELLLTIKSQEGNFRLLLSASASLPLVYLTQTNKPSPLTAPNFCMLLRKHISGGRIIAVTQPSMERILRFEIEHLDETIENSKQRVDAFHETYIPYECENSSEKVFNMMQGK